MRKMRVALVLLLLLAFIGASQVSFAKATISPGSMGDVLSIAKSRALLQNIEKKLVSGNSDIAKANKELSDYTKYMAKQNIANATKVPGANKTKSTIKPPSMRGYGVPMSGIGDAIKALGSNHMKLVTPVEIAKSMSMPKLAVIK
jgi:hypothetical protein